MERGKFYFIYNFHLTLFLMREGLIPVEIGKGSKDEIYHKFVRDFKSEEAMRKWAAY